MLPVTTWRPELDNPNFLGWTVVTAYSLASVSCGWVAVKAGKIEPDAAKIWWFLAAVLLFLAVNKQLNLQTLLIVIGRRVTLAHGWYERRRIIQAVFCVIFAALGIVALRAFAGNARRFIRDHQMAFGGAVILVLFVILRALTINHGNDILGVDLKDENWAWTMELCGSGFIIAGAVKAAAAFDQRRI